MIVKLKFIVLISRISFHIVKIHSTLIFSAISIFSQFFAVCPFLSVLEKICKSATLHVFGRILSTFRFYISSSTKFFIQFFFLERSTFCTLGSSLSSLTKVLEFLKWRNYFAFVSNHQILL